MNTRKIAAVAIILLVNRFGFADASYQSTSQMTGGPMIDQLKSIPFLSKSMKGLTAPSSTITMVHGNQKAIVTKATTQIWDLDKETIITIDNVKKTYWLETFAEARQAIANMPKQIQNLQAQTQGQKIQAPTMPSNMTTSFDVSAKNTGATKLVNGVTAQEQLVTMAMHVTATDASSGQANTITYYVTTDAWIIPDPPAVKEVKDFDLRMGKKMMAGADLAALKASLTGLANNTGMSQVFASHPGSQEAMTQMVKEKEKLQGTSVIEVTTMGGGTNGPIPATPDSSGASPTGDAATGSAPAGTTPVTSPSGTTPVGQQPTTGGATPSSVPQSGKLGALGSVFGGWRKNKQAPAPDATTSTTPTTAADPNAPAGVGTNGGVSQIMMQTTVETSNFSNEAIPPSVFELPAGLTKVPSPLDAMNKMTQ
jgi:hypothetical protein